MPIASVWVAVSKTKISQHVEGQKRFTHCLFQSLSVQSHDAG